MLIIRSFLGVINLSSELFNLIKSLVKLRFKLLFLSNNPSERYFLARLCLIRQLLSVYVLDSDIRVSLGNSDGHSTT